MLDDRIREETEKICPMCAPDRRQEGLEPNRLLRLAPTAKQNLEVLVCPTCDGIT